MTTVDHSKQHTKIGSSSTPVTSSNLAQHSIGCIIADGTSIDGIIKADDYFRFDGALEGSLSCEKKLIVGLYGKIVGSVWANEADISGTINGDIETAELLILRKTSLIRGNIKAKSISVESGAICEGVCQIG